MLTGIVTLFSTHHLAFYSKLENPYSPHMNFLWVLLNSLLNLTVMQEHVRPPPLQKVSLLCILDTDFTQDPAFAKAASVLNIVTATHSSYSTVAKRNQALNMLGLQHFIFLLLY